MILSIPYQALEIGNIHLNPFYPDRYGKSLAQLSYKDTSIDFNDVSILTPPLRIINYNPVTHRLRLDLSDQFNFMIKLNAFQQYLVSTFYVHQQSFLGNSIIHPHSHSEINSLFHFLLYNSILSLFAFPNVPVKLPDNNTSSVLELKSGDTIRCVIRFQGISLNKNKYGFKLRLQHSIPSIWKIT
jgi:hypothetical protein